MSTRSPKAARAGRGHRRGARALPGRISDGRISGAAGFISRLDDRIVLTSGAGRGVVLGHGGRDPHDLVSALLDAAISRRQGAGPVARLVNDVADALPGLVVDRFGAHLRVETTEEGWRARAHDVVDAVIAHGIPLEGATCVWRRARGAGAKVSRLWGEVPPNIVVDDVVDERVVRFCLRPADRDAAGIGLFLDQRHSRDWIAQHATARPALNLFAHAGAFGVAMAAGGASRVDHVDLARKCAPWAALNLALNGHDPRRHRFIVDDVRKVLERITKRGARYGTIVCDPPTTALGAKGKRMLGRQVLDVLATHCLRALDDEGCLALSCNDRGLRAETFASIVEDAARRARRSIASVVPLRLGADFPDPGDARLVSTRGVWVKVG